MRKMIVRKIAVAVSAGCVVAGLGAAALASTVGLSSAAAAQPITLRTGSLKVGVALAAEAADPWENAKAVRSADGVLSSDHMLQAQSLMGWGVGNPEPSPGVYNWGGLARRFAQITRTGGTPVLTLCGAPDWMAGHKAGETDWARLGEAPTPSHYQAFARLAAAAARRFPQVHYFQVWNELKGFWDQKNNNWSIADYTRLYNDVYRAIKAVNPNDKVGGPYVVMASYDHAVKGAAISGPWGAVDPRATQAVKYWLDHKVGADFISVDADDEPTWGAPATGAVGATAKLSAVDDWLRANTSLPIWWSEVYVQPEGSRWSSGRQAAMMTVALSRISTSGAAVALLWGPEADGQPRILGYLWSSCQSADGGRPTPLAASFEAWNKARQAGRRETILVDPDGTALRWSKGTSHLSLQAWQVVYGAT
jgi:hypothetical protein